MGHLWLLIAAPAAVLAAWLFLTTYDQQRVDQKAQQTEMQRDRAEFDRDFAKAWDGKQSPELTQRASEAGAALVQAQAEQAQAEAQRKADHEAEKAQIAELLAGSKK